MSEISTSKLGVVFLGRKRPGFDVEWGQKIERDVREFIKRLPGNHVIPKKVTDDRSLRSAIEACRQERCDVLIALQPTMSDGRFAPVIAQLWGKPVVLWATPENPNSNKVSSCSLVGTHMFASTLRQLGHPFELVYGAPEDPRLVEDLADAVEVTHTVGLLRGVKVGLIGSHAPGFIAMHSDPFELAHNLGVELHQLGIQELVDTSNSVPETQVQEDVEKVLAMGLPYENVSADDLPTNSRLYLAMKDIAREEHLDALAVQEWPELPNLTGQWAYLAMLRLTMEGYPVAIEGDVDGALICLIGKSLGMGTGYLSDWLGHDQEIVHLWHMGNAPFDICEPVGSERGPRLALHYNIPKPLTVNADVASDRPVTLTRLWRCDGVYRMMAQEGTTLRPDRSLMGTNAIVRMDVPDTYEWFDELVHEGMPHHVAVFPGHYKRRLRRFARQMGIELID